MSNVLMTPSSVVETIRLSFPQAQIASKVRGAGFALACTLVPHSQSFRVSRMLDANEFDLTLKEIFDQLAVSRILQQQLPEIQLDIERFSLVPPLSEWKPKIMNGNRSKSSIRSGARNCSDIPSTQPMISH